MPTFVRVSFESDVGDELSLSVADLAAEGIRALSFCNFNKYEVAPSTVAVVLGLFLAPVAT